MGKASKSLPARLRRFNADSLPSLLQYEGVERPSLDPWAARWQAHPVHAAYAAACQAVGVLQQLGTARVAWLVESEPELAQALADTFFCCPAGAPSLGAFLAGSGLADLAGRYFGDRGGDAAAAAPAAAEAQGANGGPDKEELLDAFLTCHWLLAGWALAITLLTADRSAWGPNELAAAAATRQAILTATTSLWQEAGQPPLSGLLERQRPPAWAVAAVQSAVRACEQLLGASGPQEGVAFTRLAGQEVPWQLEGALCTLSSCLLGGWVLLGGDGRGGGSWAPADGAAGERAALTEDELNNLANAALEAADTVRRAGYDKRTREWHKRWLPESHVHLVVLAVAAAYASLFVGSERPTQRTVAVDMLGWLPYEFLHTEMPNVLNTQRRLAPGGLPASLACHTLAPIYTHLLHCIDACRTDFNYRDPATAKVWNQAAAEERGRLDAEAATAAVAPAFGFRDGGAQLSTAGRGGGSSSSSARELPAAGSSAEAAAGGQAGGVDAPYTAPAASQPRPASPSRLMPPGGPLLSAEDDATEALVLIASLMHAALTIEDCQQQLAAGRAGGELAAAGLPPPRPAGQHLCVTAVAAVQAILKEMLGSGRPLCTAHGPYVQRVVSLCLQAARAGGAALPGVTGVPPAEPLAVLAEEAADIVRSRRLLVDLVEQEQERMDREAKAAAHAAAQKEKRAAKKKAQREAKRAQRAQQQQQQGEADVDSEAPSSSAASTVQRQGEEQQQQQQQQQAEVAASSAVGPGGHGGAAVAGAPAAPVEQQGQDGGTAEEDDEQRRQRAEEVAQQLLREEEERAEAAAARAAQRAAKKKAKRQQRRHDPSASRDDEGPSCSAAQQAARAAGQAATAGEPAAAQPAAADASPASPRAPASEGDMDEWEAAAERLLATVSTSSAAAAAQPTPAAAAEARRAEADVEAEWEAAAARFEAGSHDAGSSNVLSVPPASAYQEEEWETAAASLRANGAADRSTTSSGATPAAAVAPWPEPATLPVSGAAAGGGQQQQQHGALGEQPPWAGIGSRAPAAQQAAPTAGMVLLQRWGPELAAPATPALAPQPAAVGAPGGPPRWSSLVATGQAPPAGAAVRPPPGFAQPAAGGGAQMPPGFPQPAAASAQWPSLGASSTSSSSATSAAPQLGAAAHAVRCWAPLGGPPPAVRAPLSQPPQPPSSAPPARGPHVHPSASAPAFVGQPQHADAAGPKHCVVECVLCLEAPPDCVLLPCRHLALCTACAEGAWQAQQPAATKLCPVCRTEVAHLFQVFLP